MKIFITLFSILFSAILFADVPKEIQGTWEPDIEASMVLLEKNMPEMDSAFMRERYLPQLKRIISEKHYIHMTGIKEVKADITLKEKQGNKFIVVLSGNPNPDMEVTFIPTGSGYIMQGPNPADGSGSIVWTRQ